MLYHLFNYLKDFNFPGHGLVTYLSFRAIAAVVISIPKFFIICLPI